MQYVWPLQVVGVFLVRVFPQVTGGQAGFVIIPLLLYMYHPRHVTMLTAAAPSYSIILDHCVKGSKVGS